MTTILYIAGSGRSGTTILGNVLGQLPGFVSVGELHNVWKRGLRDERDCGCGRRLRDCEHWQRSFDVGFGGMDRVDPEQVMASQRQIRTRHVHAVARAVRRGTLIDDYAYARHLRALYDGIVAASGAEVIVDSSKFPVDAVVAAGLPGYEVVVAHMVRDPRAVAHSWHRRKLVQDKPSGLLQRVNLVRSSVVWQGYNAVIEGPVRRAVGSSRYRRVSYEALALDPESTVRDLVGLAGRPSPPTPVFDGGWVDLAPSHTGGGNPVRFASGRTLIRADDDWVDAMPRWRKGLVTALSSPMLRRMGYRTYT